MSLKFKVGDECIYKHGHLPCVITRTWEFIDPIHPYDVQFDKDRKCVAAQEWDLLPNYNPNDAIKELIKESKC